MRSASALSSTTARPARTCTSAISSVDDFGGPQFEGCPEVLNDTRPDVILDLHDSFFDVGGDVVETNTFGGFSTVLVEYGIPERAHELGGEVGPDRPRSGRAATAPTSGWPARWARAPRWPRSTGSRFAELRDSYETLAARSDRGRRRPAHHRDGAGPAPGQGRDDRRPPAMAAIGPRGADPGPGHDRDHRPHAARHRDRRRPDRARARCGPTSSASTAPPARARWASTCATCRRTRRSRSPAFPTRACRRSSTARRITTSRPSSWPTSTPASSPTSACRSSAAAAAPRPSTWPRSSSAAATSRPAAAHADPRARRGVDLHAGHLRPGHLVPRDRRAHQRQRLAGVPRRDARRGLGHVRGHGARAGQGRRRTSSTSASTTSAATAARHGRAGPAVRRARSPRR